MATVKSNERSEAIELIKLMDNLAQQNTWEIRSVGGERTINTGDKRMFPDVILYGDTDRTQILQGWEIKMPDVPVTDDVFIHDAQRKADVLKLNSCFIWNFTYGVLYIKNEDGWKKEKEWQLPKIKSRNDVLTFKSEWEKMITAILSELNGLFVTGNLKPAVIGEIISDTIFDEILSRNKSITADHLRSSAKKNTVIKAHITQWWNYAENEYKFDCKDQYTAYAQIILINWAVKFTFAHLIKANHNPANSVESINKSTSATDALKIFESITSKCDFFNIFKEIEYCDLLPTAAWNDLVDYNTFLSQNGISAVPQSGLQSMLENSVNQFKRNAIGVFATPPIIAKILVKAGITDMTAPIIDPCCGTGTIVSEIIEAKKAALNNIKQTYDTTLASDKFSFPLQISNLAMTRAEAINQPCYLFQINAFDLNNTASVKITDPATGKISDVVLPKFGGIASNLPFVAFDQEGREESNNIKNVVKDIKNSSKISLSMRSDLYQALILELRKCLTDDASVAVITSNSWLGTSAGLKFFEALNYFYSVDSVVISGKGRWFSNADVVTAMLFMKKKEPQTAAEDHKINFGLIHRSVNELTDEDAKNISDSILLRLSSDTSLISFREYTMKQIKKLLGMNITLNSFFYDIEWLNKISDKFCPISDLFEVFRGMKTGQDEIWYLNSPNDIEQQFIGRILKTVKSIEMLTADPDTYSFVCNKTVPELKQMNCSKALERIERFKGHLNQSVPNKKTFWMNLANNVFSGSHPVRLITGMNPESRIFFSLLNQPAQINQRAIGFMPKTDDINLELCHALLNSVIGIFFIEATGFPKGLGALDNSASKIAKAFMLDPRKLPVTDANRILDAFKPLLERKVKMTEEEYTLPDRLNFEHIVAKCFGYDSEFNQIKDCVLKMMRVRLSVKK